MFFFYVVVVLSHSIYNKVTYAQVSIVTHGSLALLEPFLLECQVTPFSGGATWSKDYGVTLLTQCFSGGLCTDSGSGNYQYYSNTTGIFVTIASLTADEKGITWTCSHSTFNASYTIPEPGPPLEKNDKAKNEGIPTQVAFSVVLSISFGVIAVCSCIPILFTAIRVKKWFPVFSRQYDVCGRLYFGIHIAIVAASIQLSTIIIAAIILSVYSGQYDDYVILLLVLLIPLYSLFGVGVFLLIIACGGQVHKKEERNANGSKDNTLMITESGPLDKKSVITKKGSLDKSEMVTECDSQENSGMVSKLSSLDKKLVTTKSGSLDNKLVITKGGSLDKTESGSQKGQTALLIFVVFVPVAWFVLLILLLRILCKNCSEIENKEKGDVNKKEEKVKQVVKKEKEKGKSEVKNQKEKGKGNNQDVIKEEGQGKPGAREETGNQEQETADIGKQNVWANTPNGRQLPSLPEIGKPNDEGIDPAQKGNKKKKRNKQKNAVSNDESAQYTDIGTD